MHGNPLGIVSDRDLRFTSELWEGLQSAFGTRLRLGLAYHPQADGQTERTIWLFKDLLRACVLKQGCVWNDFLPLIGQYKDFCLVCELT